MREFPHEYCLCYTNCSTDPTRVGLFALQCAKTLSNRNRKAPSAALLFDTSHSKVFQERFDCMHYTRCTLAFISAIFLASAGFHARAQPIVVEELGDDEMSCQALYDNIKQMDAVLTTHAPSSANAQNSQKDASRVMQEAARETRSGEVAQIANLFGRLISSAGAVQQPNTLDQSQLRAQAQARKQHLTNLFRGKKCKVSTLRK